MHIRCIRGEREQVIHYYSCHPSIYEMKEFNQSAHVNDLVPDLDLGPEKWSTPEANKMFPCQVTLLFWMNARKDSQKTIPGHPAHVLETIVVGAGDPTLLKEAIRKICGVVRTLNGLQSEIKTTVVGGAAPLPIGTQFSEEFPIVEWERVTSLYRGTGFTQITRRPNVIAIFYTQVPGTPIGVRFPTAIYRKKDGANRYAGLICRGRGGFKPLTGGNGHDFKLSGSGILDFQAVLLVFQRLRALNAELEGKGPGALLQDLPAEIVDMIINMMLIGGGYTLDIVGGAVRRGATVPLILNHRMVQRQFMA
jgi:hypothetical protein